MNTKMNDQQNLTEVLDNELSEIKTLDLDEGINSELDFLKESIGDAQIILLGEQDHGDGTSFLAKAKIIQYLHEKMGFNVLAFESDFYGCNTSGDLFNNKKISAESLKKCLWDFWTTGTNIQQFYDYLEKQNNSDNSLYITGFDCQYYNSKRQVAFVETYIEFIKYSLSADQLEQDVLNSFLKIITKLFSVQNDDTFTDNDKDMFFYTIDSIIEIARHDSSSFDPFFIQEMKNLKGFANYVWCTEDDKLIRRDTQMAENVIWLHEHKFKGEKMIIWAHSFHTLKDYSYLISDDEISESKAEGISLNWIGHLMGEILNSRYADKIYSIGFIAFQGEYNNKAYQYNFNDVEEITSKKYSLEEAIHERQIDYGFINLKYSNFPDFLISGDCHNEARIADWKQVFDGLFFIDTMEGIH